MNKNPKFKCKACQFSCDELKFIQDHTFLNHSNENSNNKFKCVHNSCEKSYKKYSDWSSHILLNHKEKEKNNQTIKCNVPQCNSTLKDIDTLYRHYYAHISKNESENQNNFEFFCFFKDCNYKCSTTNSKVNFKKHLSTYHSDSKELRYLKNEMFESVEEEDFEVLYENDLVNEAIMEQSFVDYDKIDSVNNLSKRMNERILNLTKVYMKLYLKLKDKYLIAEYKCNEFFDDLDSIIKVNNTHLLDIIEKQKSYNTNDSNILEIVKSNLNNSIFEQIHSTCKYDSYKEKWLTHSGFLVNPTRIELSLKENYQYISILGSLKALFMNKQICDAYFESIENKTQISKKCETISSFNDSLNFKNNKLFSSDPTAIQVVLYDDAYDTANPLGDHRLDKINGTYFRIGNMENSLQSVDYFTQAGIICENDLLKKYGYDKIYEPLIQDLLKLETEGIQVKYKNNFVNLKGTISMLPADNLAANTIGGYCSSFNAGCNFFYFFFKKSFGKYSRFYLILKTKKKCFIFIVSR